MGRQLDAVPVAAHGGQETAHLGERSAAGPLDAPERSRSSGERFRELVPDGSDLEHHDAHGVGDDVVELARDPRALLRHGNACGRLALALGPRRALLSGLGPLGPLAEGVARNPGDDEPKGMKTKSPVVCAPGMLSTTMRMLARTISRPMPRLSAVAQVAEQERGCQPDDAEAPDERDQHSIDERERRRQDPVGGRRGEGKAPVGEERQTRTAIAGMANQSVVVGALGSCVRPRAPPCPRTARNATRSSNQYSRDGCRMRLTR